MGISKYLVPIKEGEALFKHLLIEEFSIDEHFADSLSSVFRNHLANLSEECYLLAETNYVDKVYRDSYYTYYSSKLVSYKRDCIRISVFEGEVQPTDFTDKNQIQKVEERYRGFFILRPTEPQIIGRSLISPLVLKEKGFSVCMAKINVTVNSLKLCVEGFPHSSQDSETITCAETTLWAVMEYFGYKYPEYKPVLPSTIIKTLNKVSFERQVPSKGLNIQQMSFALKEFGFGTRIYSRVSYGNDFEKLLSTYIESGIPIILGIDNFDEGGGIGHAILCVGRQSINESMVDNLKSNFFIDQALLNKINSKGLAFYDWDDIHKQFVFIDDNYPVYQKAFLGNPVNYYNKKDWDTCTIKHFIVPLYPKIYLEAYEAKSYILHFLTSTFSPVDDNTEVLIRFYLASSRSYKHYLALHSESEEYVRDVMLETQMPKFIWVAELSTKSLIKSKKAIGLMILDATEANLNFNYPLIMAYYKDKLIIPDLQSNTLKKKIVPSHSFSIFEENLKSF